MCHWTKRKTIPVKHRSNQRWTKLIHVGPTYWALTHLSIPAGQLSVWRLIGQLFMPQSLPLYLRSILMALFCMHAIEGHGLVRGFVTVYIAIEIKEKCHLTLSGRGPTFNFRIFRGRRLMTIIFNHQGVWRFALRECRLGWTRCIT